MASEKIAMLVALAAFLLGVAASEGIRTSRGLRLIAIPREEPVGLSCRQAWSR